MLIDNMMPLYHFEHVKTGHRVGAIITNNSSSNEDYIELEITYPVDSSTSKIKPGKGMNFPDLSFSLPALTSEDINNLDFVVKHATAVALSFVHRPEDLYDLRNTLDKIGRSDIGIVAKIETAYINLTRQK